MEQATINVKQNADERRFEGWLSTSGLRSDEVETASALKAWAMQHLQFSQVCASRGDAILNTFICLM
eukprot:SAG31_NODE_460_length_15364_cov_11.851294_17_plen_67_part_00